MSLYPPFKTAVVLQGCDPAASDEEACAFYERLPADRKAEVDTATFTPPRPPERLYSDLNHTPPAYWNLREDVSRALTYCFASGIIETTREFELKGPPGALCRAATVMALAENLIPSISPHPFLAEARLFAPPECREYSPGVYHITARYRYVPEPKIDPEAEALVEQVLHGSPNALHRKLKLDAAAGRWPPKGYDPFHPDPPPIAVVTDDLGAFYRPDLGEPFTLATSTYTLEPTRRARFKRLFYRRVDAKPFLVPWIILWLSEVWFVAYFHLGWTWWNPLLACLAVIPMQIQMSRRYAWRKRQQQSEIAS